MSYFNNFVFDKFFGFIRIFYFCVWNMCKNVGDIKIYVKSFCYWACYWAYLTLFHFKFWVVFKATKIAFKTQHKMCSKLTTFTQQNTHAHNPFQLACFENKETFCTSKSLQQNIETFPTCLISKLPLTMSYSKSLKQKYGQAHTHKLNDTHVFFFWVCLKLLISLLLILPLSISQVWAKTHD